jgi:hypothetical protein
MNDNKLGNVLQWGSFIVIFPFAAHLFGFINLPNIIFATMLALLSVTVFWGLMVRTKNTSEVEPVYVEAENNMGNQY